MLVFWATVRSPLSLRLCYPIDMFRIYHYIIKLLLYSVFGILPRQQVLLVFIFGINRVVIFPSWNFLRYFFIRSPFLAMCCLRMSISLSHSVRNQYFYCVFSHYYLFPEYTSFGGIFFNDFLNLSKISISYMFFHIPLVARRYVLFLLRIH